MKVWAYPAWIALCAILFVALGDAEDPSRPEGRLLSSEAGQQALAIVRARDASRFRDYHVVHVAKARRGERGPEERWVVLLDRVPHTALDEAIVVELDSATGRLVEIRRPR